jgi:hypothetical protein
MLTMKQARKMYAGREMLSPAFKDKDGTHHRRVNVRAVCTHSFRAWVRAGYAGYAHVSPKLARVLRSDAAAAA